jgi:lipopolysaccharide/colanic/teichoic acid biosynthesis glycosyltransferase
VLIRFDSRGPILFRQERLGLGGRPFVLLKFRTMVDGPDLQRQLLTDFITQFEDLVSSGVADPRLTRVGGFLRRTSIDELPALWNVLTGRMSIVGPRPRARSDLESSVGDAAARFSVRPGLLSPTAAATLQGRDVDPGADLDYARHPSFRRDVGLLWRVFGHIAREVGKTEIRSQ